MTLLQTLAAQSDWRAADLLLVQKALGDSHALLVELGQNGSTYDHRQRAAAAYTETLHLLATFASSVVDPRVEAIRSEIEDRRARVTRH